MDTNPDGGRIAVRIRLASDDFYLLPLQDSRKSADELVARIEALHELPDSSVSVQPRTLDPAASGPGTDSAARAASADADSDTSLADPDTPGNDWHFVAGPAIQEVEAVRLSEPVAFWHWRIRESPSPAVEPPRPA